MIGRELEQAKSVHYSCLGCIFDMAALIKQLQSYHQGKAGLRIFGLGQRESALKNAVDKIQSQTFKNAYEECVFMISSLVEVHNLIVKDISKSVFATQSTTAEKIYFFFTKKLRKEQLASIGVTLSDDNSGSLFYREWKMTVHRADYYSELLTNHISMIDSSHLPAGMNRNTK